MGIPTEFKLNGDSEYTLWNGQTSFSGQTAKPRQPILRTPDEKQAIAVLWNKDTKAFTSIYFELTQEGDEQVAAAGTTGLRIAGKYKGSELFIISLPGKKLPKDLRENLTQWVENKHLFDNEGSQQKTRRRDRSMTIGALCLEIEKHIGKWEVTPKPAAPAVIQEPAQPARPPERTSILGGAAREVGERPTQQRSYSSDHNFDEQGVAGVPESDDLPYSGELKKDFERGFTFVMPDPNQNIPELGGRDAFFHISRIGISGYPENTTLRAGSRIRFSLWENKGQTQIDEVQLFGQPRPRAAVQATADQHDDLLDNLAPVTEDLELQVFKGTVARINNENAQFRHIRPDTTIPELEGKDAFVHFNQVPEAETFREGERVEFQLEFSPTGRIQVSNAAHMGSLRPLQHNQQHDQERLPANYAHSNTYDEVPYDPNTPQPPTDPDFYAAGEPERDRRGRVIIKEIPIRTLHGFDVIPGGLPRNPNDPS